MEEIEQITDSIIDNLLLKNIKSSIKNNGGVGWCVLQTNFAGVAGYRCNGEPARLHD